MKNRLLLVFLILTLFLAVPFASSASTFTNLVVFGDSLSDNGNVGRFTDGPIWVETLATELGAGLADFAYGGATTDYDNPAINSPITGLKWQLDTFLPGFVGADLTQTLFSVWAGANDFLQARSPFLAADNIGMTLEQLYATGARNILVGNLPDMGLTPALFGLAPASDFTTVFNLALDSVLLDFEAAHGDANLFSLDAYDIFSTYSPGTPEWLNLFWADGFHPSSTGHQLIAESAISALATVPEPTTMVLFGIGLLGLVGGNRKKTV